MSPSRREFIKTTSIAGAGLLSVTDPSELLNKKAPFKSKLNVAILGSGLRGQSHISLLLKRTDCDVVAVAEPDSKMLDSTKALFSRKQIKQPTFYDQGDKDFLRLLETEDIDLAIIATPWEWHTEMAVACMKKRVYVGMEVSGAFSIDECWQLVNTHEETGTPLYFLENVCFRRDVMAILSMVRKNMFGDMIHLEGGYQHDLRGVKFNDGITPYNSGVEYGKKGFSEAKWRTKHSIYRNGDLYPTHGVGPLAQYININRGNRFVYLNSISSRATGLHDYILNHEKGGSDHPNADLKFKLGDKVTTFIKTNNDETVVLHHDTSLPRPYSLAFRVQGTKGIWMAVNKSLHIDGISPQHRWESADKYLKEYDHPLWKRHQTKAVGAGHGGMDYFLLHSLLEHAKKGEEPPFDVYDAATWMAITPLSEQSIATGSMPMPFPDFTRGRWTEKKVKFAFGDDY
jgi:predicted dehydrogenase